MKYRVMHPRPINGIRHKRFDIVKDTDLPANMIGSFLRTGVIEPYIDKLETFQEGPSLASMKRVDLIAYADEQGVTVPPGLKVADIRKLLEE